MAQLNQLSNLTQILIVFLILLGIGSLLFLITDKRNPNRDELTLSQKIFDILFVAIFWTLFFYFLVPNFVTPSSGLKVVIVAMLVELFLLRGFLTGLMEGVVWSILPKKQSGKTIPFQREPVTDDRAPALQVLDLATTYQVTLERTNTPIPNAIFEEYLDSHCKSEATKKLMRFGYSIRIAELELFGLHQDLKAVGKASEIVESTTSLPEKLEVLANYFDDHELIGIGEPLKDYVYGDFVDMQRVVRVAAKSEAKLHLTRGEDDPDYEMQEEIYQRTIAFGYALAVAIMLCDPDKEK